MRALTLWPEWLPPFLIDHPNAKRTENRAWAQTPRLCGQRFALHAGAHIGGSSSRRAADAGIGAVWRTAARAGLPLPSDWWETIPRSCVVATAVLSSADREIRTGWDFPGQWHWRLADLVVLDEPIPMAGHQGLWSLPDDVAARLRVAG